MTQPTTRTEGRRATDAEIAIARELVAEQYPDEDRPKTHPDDPATYAELHDWSTDAAECYAWTLEVVCRTADALVALGALNVAKKAEAEAWTALEASRTRGAR